MKFHCNSFLNKAKKAKKEKDGCRLKTITNTQAQGKSK